MATIGRHALGTMIDQNLRWTNHISYIKKKIAKGIGILSKARKYLNSDSLKTLYHSFIYPYLDYCIEVWGSACITHLDPLYRMQKKAIRMITFSHYKTQSTFLFKKCKLLNLSEIHYFKVALFMYKLHHNKVPLIFQSYFKSNYEIHNYNTRNRDKLRRPTWKHEIMKQSIRLKGVTIWNNVKSSMVVETSYNSYKSNLRKIILSHEDITKILH